MVFRYRVLLMSLIGAILASVPVCLADTAHTPTMKLEASYPRLSLMSMGSAKLTVKAIVSGGLSVPVDGSGATIAIASGLPVGVTAAFSSPSVAANSTVSWTMTLQGSTAASGSAGTLKIASTLRDGKTGKLYSATTSLALTVTFVAPILDFAPAVTHLPLTQGATVTDVFHFTPGGSFHGSIRLAILGLPSGITASWSSNPVGVSSGAGTSTLKLSADSSVPVNWYPFTVIATGDGLTVSRLYTAIVQQSSGVQVQLSQSKLTMKSMETASVTVTAVPLGKAAFSPDGTGAQASIASALPSGVSAAFGAPTVTSSGAVTWALTLSGSPLAVADNTTLVVSIQIVDANTAAVYSASQGLKLAVVLTPATLAFSPDATHVPVLQGASATDGFHFQTGGSFQGAIHLSIAGLPSGVTASWTSNPVTVSGGTGTSTLTLAANGTVKPEWYPFTVTATGDGLSLKWTYTVEVEPSIGVVTQMSQQSLTIEPLGTAAITVTAIPMNGIQVQPGAAGSSATVVSGLPTGVTGKWNAPSVTSKGALVWTLSLSADSSASAGDYPVQLAIAIVDRTSGLTYRANPSFPLLVGLLANVNIGSVPGAPIAPSFMGLSHEWGSAQTTMGSSSTGVNRIYRQLLTNLTSYGSGPLVVRIGGNSTDRTGEPTSATVQPFVELAETVGAHFSLGVNLGFSNVNLAVDQAKAYANSMPAGYLDELEVGNEPDLYAKNGTRPSNYTVQDYFSEFQNWQTNISPVIAGRTKLMGTAWGSPEMLSHAQEFEAAHAPALSAFSQHYYAINPQSQPAFDFLLKPAAATAGPSAVAAAVATTHGYGLPFRVGEMNSISDEGVHGISDAFGAALWAIDTMFEYAQVGVDGVNWEASVGNYDAPFLFNSSTTGGKTSYSLSAVTPLYYGLLVFQNATQNGARLLPVNLDTPANMKAWATVDASGDPRLVVINKDEVQTGTVSISLPGYTQANVLRLTAPSYQATSGVTLGGQTFDGSTDGTIQGTQTVETIEGNGGVFQLPMSITSAALVTFHR